MNRRTFLAIAAAAPIAAKAGSEAAALPSVTATVQGLDPALEWSEGMSVLFILGADGVRRSLGEIKDFRPLDRRGVAWPGGPASRTD